MKIFTQRAQREERDHRELEDYGYSSFAGTICLFIFAKDKAADLQKAGVEIIEGDSTNANSIAPALKNVDDVLTAAHGLLVKGKNSLANVDKIGHIALIKAAVDAGVKQFIYTSVHAWYNLSLLS